MGVAIRHSTKVRTPAPRKVSKPVNPFVGRATASKPAKFAKLTKPTKPTKPTKQRKPRRAKRPIAGLDRTIVLIDDRAGSKELVNYSPFDRIGCLARLDSADVSFYGNGPDGEVRIGIELKSLGDLISSIDTGRLQATQITAMLDEYDETHLVYYGRFRCAPRSHELQTWSPHKHRDGAVTWDWRPYCPGNRQKPVSYAALQGFIAMLSKLGVTTWRVEDMDEAAACIEELVRVNIKPYYQHKSFRVFDTSQKVSGRDVEKRRKQHRAVLMPTRTDPVTDLLARLAKELPALAYERACAAAEHFDCVQDMFLASAHEWANIHTADRSGTATRRLGPNIAEAIVQAVTARKQRNGNK